MSVKSQDHKLDQLVILDFDGAIFFNTDQNYTIDIPLRDILDAQTFFSEFQYQTGRILPRNIKFALVTGRSQAQQHFILELLKAKGYEIDSAYFSQIQRTEQMEESTFMIEYWNAKVKLINQLNQDEQYESVIVIDDDPIVCMMAERLHIEVYEAEMLKHIPKQIITVRFRPVPNDAMSDLITMFRNQKVRSKKPVQTTM